MASEAQVLAAWNAATSLEEEAERCCKNMVVWETYVQIVRLNTNTRTSTGTPDAGGVVVSSFHSNRNSGITREHEIYTATFARKFDSGIYAPYTTVAGTNGEPYTTFNLADLENIDGLIQYRTVQDANIALQDASSLANESQRRHNFLKFVAWNDNSAGISGNIINNAGSWGSFIQEIADDGTVSITDFRPDANFTVIRYYTQWTLRQCADGSILPDPT